MINDLLEATRARAKHRVWLISDIQMADLDFIRRCIETSIADYRSLDRPCEVVWYLGDAGANNTDKTAALQLELFRGLNLPLRFINGGHDFDLTHRYLEECGIVLPFYRHVQKEPGWKTTEKVSDLYFTDEIGPYMVYFFPNHADEDFNWWAGTVVQGKVDDYPYTQAFFDKLREEMGSCGKPVILCTHEPLPPAIRASELHARLFPLPDNVVANFHGHCHIGERSTYNTTPYCKLTWMNDQDIPQINVSAMEDKRGDAIRSAFLELYEDGSLGVLFRNHSELRWTETFFLDPSRKGERGTA